jgi:hypothetical protein
MGALVVIGTALAGCGAPVGPAPDAPDGARYLGVTAEVIDPALIRFEARMRGARDAADVDAYARCGVAGYAVAQGFGFARQVRTRVDNQGGVWRADAVYTLSPALPAGIRTIDAEVTAADCAERGIPTG